MKNFLQCRACGYIVRKSKRIKICPACGLPKTVFKDFKEKISYKRNFILNLDLHPIFVHFTEALGFIISIAILLSFISSTKNSNEFLIVFKWCSYFFPLSIIFTIILGIFDANIRFKNISSPFIKLKIILSNILLIISIIHSGVIYYFGININNYYTAVFCLAVLTLEIILGKIGSKLIHVFLKG